MEPHAQEVQGFAERISLTCAVTQRRMRQAARLVGCRHARAFCSEALPTLASGSGFYKCPICGLEASEGVVDIALTLFLSDHPTAESAGVRALGCGLWAYSRPRSERSTNRASGGARKSRREAAAAAAAAASTSTALSVAAAGAASSGSATTSSGGGGRPISSRPSIGCSSGDSLSRPSEKAGSRPRGGIPSRAERRAERRERASRSRLLEATRAQLIHRALNEDASTGEALFGADDTPSATDQYRV